MVPEYFWGRSHRGTFSIIFKDMEKRRGQQIAWLPNILLLFLKSDTNFNSTITLYSLAFLAGILVQYGVKGTGVWITWASCSHAGASVTKRNNLVLAKGRWRSSAGTVIADLAESNARCYLSWKFTTIRQLFFVKISSKLSSHVLAICRENLRQLDGHFPLFFVTTH